MQIINRNYIHIYMYTYDNNNYYFQMFKCGVLIKVFCRNLNACF